MNCGFFLFLSYTILAFCQLTKKLYYCTMYKYMYVGLIHFSYNTCYLMDENALLYNHFLHRSILLRSPPRVGYNPPGYLVQLTKLPPEMETLNNFCPSRFPPVCPDFPFFSNRKSGRGHT